MSSSLRVTTLVDGKWQDLDVDTYPTKYAFTNRGMGIWDHDGSLGGDESYFDPDDLPILEEWTREYPGIEKIIKAIRSNGVVKVELIS